MPTKPKVAPGLLRRTWSKLVEHAFASVVSVVIGIGAMVTVAIQVDAIYEHRDHASAQYGDIRGDAKLRSLYHQKGIASARAETLDERIADFEYLADSGVITPTQKALLERYRAKLADAKVRVREIQKMIDEARKEQQ